jgi:NAD(P)-dependent dehydrogenase (short-subunit alcohol dehydrogenase family)
LLPPNRNDSRLSLHAGTGTVSRIVVTGAGGALGAAVVRTLSGSGAEVIAVDLAADMPPCGQSSFFGGVDLADAAAADDVFDRIRDACGAMDGLANVAGGFRWETVTGGSSDAWDALYQINVRTAVNACRAAVPLLVASRGAIVNVAALAAVSASAGMGAYAASKAGVMRLTESLADELKKDCVRVNAVLPSIIDTPANRHDMPDVDHSKWVTPEALAEVIRFLLSSLASAVTGACLPVRGWV